jgi:PHP domain-containing protein
VEVLAACHLHSAWSYDGSWPIETMVEAFIRRGYRVMMMTEHENGFTQARYAEFRAECERLTSDRMYVLPGIEYSDPENRVHVLVWGTPFLGEGLRTEALLDAVAAAGGVAVFAHPSRRAAWECFTPRWAETLLGIEAWNRKYDGWAPGDDAAELLDSNAQAPFVGLDFHTARQFFPLGMALELTGDISEHSVLECLKQRRCTPRAFGLPLDQRSFHRTLPLLHVAEQGRRRLAALKRYSKARLLVR